MSTNNLSKSKVKRSFLIAIAVLIGIGVGVAAGFILLKGNLPITQKQPPATATPTTPTESQKDKHSESETKLPEGALVSKTYGHVHALAIVPEGGRYRLLMGTHYGLFTSADEGKTWEKVKVQVELEAADFMHFVVDPTNPQIVYAAGHDLWVVKSLDGGRTWQKSAEGLTGSDVHGLAMNFKDPQKLFAFVVDKGVFLTKDGGQSWRRIDDGPENPSVRSLAYIAVVTDMDKSMGTTNTADIGYLYAGTGGGLYRSYSCFCGWNFVESPAFQDVTVLTLATSPADPHTLYGATKKGIFKSTDDGSTWTAMNNGLTSVNIHALAVHPSDPKLVFAATEDGIVFKSVDGGESWQRQN